MNCSPVKGSRQALSGHRTSFPCIRAIQVASLQLLQVQCSTWKTYEATSNERKENNTKKKKKEDAGEVLMLETTILS